MFFHLQGSAHLSTCPNIPCKSVTANPSVEHQCVDMSGVTVASCRVLGKQHEHSHGLCDVSDEGFNDDNSVLAGCRVDRGNEGEDLVDTRTDDDKLKDIRLHVGSDVLLDFSKATNSLIGDMVVGTTSGLCMDSISTINVGQTRPGVLAGSASTAGQGGLQGASCEKVQAGIVGTGPGLLSHTRHLLKTHAGEDTMDTDEDSLDLQKDYQSLLSVYTANLLNNFWDQDTEQFVHPRTGSLLGLQEALANSILPRNLHVQLPDKQDISIIDALNSGQLDPKTGRIVDQSCGTSCTLQAVVRQGTVKLQLPSDRVSDEHMVGCLRRQLGCGLLELVVAGLASVTVQVIDRKSGDRLSLPEAIRHSLFNPDTAELRDSTSGRWLSWDQAATAELIFDSKPVSLHQSILSAKFDRSLQKFVDPSGELQQGKTLSAMIGEGLVDVARQEILDAKNEQWITVEDAVSKGILDPLKNTYFHNVLETSLSFVDAVEAGLICEQGSDAADVTFTSFASDQLADICPEHFGHIFPLSIFEALEKNIISGKSGDVLVGEKRLPFKVAYKEKLLTADRTYIVEKSTGLTYDFRESVDMGMVDISTGSVVDTLTGEKHTLPVAKLKGLVRNTPCPYLELTTAAEFGILDFEEKRIIHPQSKKAITITQAIGDGIIDPHSVLTQHEGRSISLQEAITDGILNIDTLELLLPGGKLQSMSECLGVPKACSGRRRSSVLGRKCSLTLDEAINNGIYDPLSNSVMSREGFLSLSKALSMGIIHSDSLVRDPYSGDILSLKEALEKRLLDPESGKMIDSTGMPIALNFALEKGLILKSKAPLHLSLSEALDEGLFNVAENLFVNPDSSEEINFLTALHLGIIDDNLIKLRDTRTGEVLSLEVAAQHDLIDLESGTCLSTFDGQRYSVVDGLDKGIIIDITNQPAMSLLEAVDENLLDMSSCLLRDPVGQYSMNLQDALEANFIDRMSISVRDINSKTLLTIDGAISQNLINPHSGAYRASSDSDDEITFQEAFDNCLIFSDAFVPEKSLLEAVKQGFYNWRTGKFIDPSTGRVSRLRDMVAEGYIDPDSLLVLDSKRKKMLTFTEATEQKVLDTKVGMVVNTETNELLNLREAMDRGLLQENIKAISLSLQEVVRAGLLQRNNGKIMDPLSRKSLSVEKAMDIGLVDVSQLLVSVTDNRKYLFFDDACHEGIVFVDDDKLVFSRTGVAYDFVTAFNRNILIEIHKGGFLLGDVLSYGLYDEVHQRFIDPLTGEKLTLAEAIQSGVINDNKPQVAVPEVGIFSLKQAIDKGLIDPHTGSYIASNTPLTLTEAVDTKRLLIARNRQAEEEFRKSMSSLDSLEHLPSSLTSSKSSVTTYSKDTESSMDVDSCDSGQRVTHIRHESETLDDISSEDEDTTLSCSSNVDSVTLRQDTNGYITHEDFVANDSEEFVANDNEDFVANENEDFLANDYQEFVVNKYSEFVANDYPELEANDYDVQQQQDLRTVITRQAHVDIKAYNNTMSTFNQTFDQSGSEMVPRSLARIPQDLKFTRDLSKEACDSPTVSEKLPDELDVSFTESEASIPVTFDAEEDVTAVSKRMYYERSQSACSDSIHKLAKEKVEAYLKTERSHSTNDLDGHLSSNASSKKDELLKDLQSHWSPAADELSASLDLLLQDAIRKQLIEEKPLSLFSTVDKGVYDDISSYFCDPETGSVLNLHEAVTSGLVDDGVREVICSHTEQPMTLREAIEAGVIDAVHGKFLDRNTGAVLSLKQARDVGLIFKEKYSPRNTVEIHIEDTSISQITSRRQFEDAFSSGILHRSNSQVVDPDSVQGITLRRAVSLGLIDMKTGDFRNPQTGETMSVAAAVERGYILSPKGLSLYSAVDQGLYFEFSGQFVNPATGTIKSLQELITESIISAQHPEIRDMSQENICTLGDAIRKKIIDAHKGMYVHPFSKEDINFKDAISAGLIISTSTREGLQDPSRSLSQSPVPEYFRQMLFSASPDGRSTPVPSVQADKLMLPDLLGQMPKRLSLPLGVMPKKEAPLLNTVADSNQRSPIDSVKMPVLNGSVDNESTCRPCVGQSLLARAADNGHLVYPQAHAPESKHGLMPDEVATDKESDLSSGVSLTEHVDSLPASTTGESRGVDIIVGVQGHLDKPQQQKDPQNKDPQTVFSGSFGSHKDSINLTAGNLQKSASQAVSIGSCEGDRNQVSKKAADFHTTKEDDALLGSDVANIQTSDNQNLNLYPGGQWSAVHDALDNRVDNIKNRTIDVDVKRMQNEDPNLILQTSKFPVEEINVSKEEEVKFKKLQGMQLSSEKLKGSVDSTGKIGQKMNTNNNQSQEGEMLQTNTKRANVEASDADKMLHPGIVPEKQPVSVRHTSPASVRHTSPANRAGKPELTNKPRKPQEDNKSLPSGKNTSPSNRSGKSELANKGGKPQGDSSSIPDKNALPANKAGKPELASKPGKPGDSKSLPNGKNSSPANGSGKPELARKPGKTSGDTNSLPDCKKALSGKPELATKPGKPGDSKNLSDSKNVSPSSRSGKPELSNKPEKLQEDSKRPPNGKPGSAANKSGKPDLAIKPGKSSDSKSLSDGKNVSSSNRSGKPELADKPGKLPKDTNSVPGGENGSPSNTSGKPELPNKSGKPGDTKRLPDGKNVSPANRSGKPELANKSGKPSEDSKSLSGSKSPSPFNRSRKPELANKPGKLQEDSKRLANGKSASPGKPEVTNKSGRPTGDSKSFPKPTNAQVNDQGAIIFIEDNTSDTNCEQTSSKSVNSLDSCQAAHRENGLGLEEQVTNVVNTDVSSVSSSKLLEQVGFGPDKRKSVPDKGQSGDRSPMNLKSQTQARGSVQVRQNGTLPELPIESNKVGDVDKTLVKIETGIKGSGVHQQFIPGSQQQMDDQMTCHEQQAVSVSDQSMKDMPQHMANLSTQGEQRSSLEAECGQETNAVSGARSNANVTNVTTQPVANKNGIQQNDTQTSIDLSKSELHQKHKDRITDSVNGKEIQLVGSYVETFDNGADSPTADSCHIPGSLTADTCHIPENEKLKAGIVEHPHAGKHVSEVKHTKASEDILAIPHTDNIDHERKPHVIDSSSNKDVCEGIKEQGIPRKSVKGISGESLKDIPGESMKTSATAASATSAALSQQSEPQVVQSGSTAISVNPSASDGSDRDHTTQFEDVGVPEPSDSKLRKSLSHRDEGFQEQRQGKSSGSPVQPDEFSNQEKDNSKGTQNVGHPNVPAASVSLTDDSYKAQSQTEGACDVVSNEPEIICGEDSPVSLNKQSVASDKQQNWEAPVNSTLKLHAVLDVVSSPGSNVMSAVSDGRKDKVDVRALCEPVSGKLGDNSETLSGIVPTATLQNKQEPLRAGQTNTSESLRDRASWEKIPDTAVGSSRDGTDNSSKEGIETSSIVDRNPQVVTPSYSATGKLTKGEDSIVGKIGDKKQNKMTCRVDDSHQSTEDTFSEHSNMGTAVNHLSGSVEGGHMGREVLSQKAQFSKNIAVVNSHSGSFADKVSIHGQGGSGQVMMIQTATPNVPQKTASSIAEVDMRQSGSQHNMPGQESLPTSGKTVQTSQEQALSFGEDTTAASHARGTSSIGASPKLGNRSKLGHRVRFRGVSPEVEASPCRDSSLDGLGKEKDRNNKLQEKSDELGVHCVAHREQDTQSTLPSGRSPTASQGQKICQLEHIKRLGLNLEDIYSSTSSLSPSSDQEASTPEYETLRLTDKLLKLNLKAGVTARDRRKVPSMALVAQLVCGCALQTLSYLLHDLTAT